VVASATYEARARGIRTAMPIAQAVRVCPDGIFLRGDFAFYSELSRRMRDVLFEHTPLVEMVSMDEGFLDLTGCQRHYRCAGSAASCGSWPLDAACRIQADVRRRTGLAVSIGVATSRVVAKIASKLAKPGGVLHVHPGNEAVLLAPLAVKELPGVGPKTAARLERYGLRSIGDLAGVSRELLLETFGSTGEYLYEACRGRGSARVVPEADLPRSVSRETTFQQDTCDRRAILAMLSYLLQRACRQLRAEGLLAATVSLKLRYSDFQTVARSRSLGNPTDHDDAFYAVLCDLLPRTYTRRVAVRLVGVSLSGLVPSGRQMLLFDEASYERRTRLYASVDAVRERFGFTSLVTSHAVDLLETHERTRDGFQLPVACLSR
jgi:DNA polymerase-4